MAPRETAAVILLSSAVDSRRIWSTDARRSSMSVVSGGRRLRRPSSPTQDSARSILDRSSDRISSGDREMEAKKINHVSVYKGWRLADGVRVATFRFLLFVSSCDDLPVSLTWIVALFSTGAPSTRIATHFATDWETILRLVLVCFSATPCSSLTMVVKFKGTSFTCWFIFCARWMG